VQVQLILRHQRYSPRTAVLSRASSPLPFRSAWACRTTLSASWAVRRLGARHLQVALQAVSTGGGVCQHGPV
jgi:hypothetical protein